MTSTTSGHKDNSPYLGSGFWLPIVEFRGLILEQFERLRYCFKVQLEHVRRLDDDGITSQVHQKLCVILIKVLAEALSPLLGA